MRIMCARSAAVRKLWKTYALGWRPTCSTQGLVSSLKGMPGSVCCGQKSKGQAHPIEQAGFREWVRGRLPLWHRAPTSPLCGG